MMRKIISVILLFPLFSCMSARDIQLGQINLRQDVDRQYFTFTVNEQFLKKYQTSPPSDFYSKITEAELKLLMIHLRHNKYCINKDGDLSFKINSKQHQLLDLTLTGVIGQSYNVAPLAPTTYFGQCIY